jgi:hypothetical protein
MVKKGPTFIDNPQAPDLFADAATGFFIFGGTLRIALESFKVDHTASPGPVNRVVIGRLVMPIEQAENLAKGILDFLEKQRSQPAPNAQSTQSIN